MLKLLACALLVLEIFLIENVLANTLNQKKIELKKIYESGGISKKEYDKAEQFLTKTKDKIKEKENNRSFSLEKKSKKNKFFFKKKDKKKILDEDLAKLETYDKKKLQEEFLKYPPEVIDFFGKNSNIISRGKKAGTYMSIEFNRSEKGQQRFPGRIIKAMAAFEIFYIDFLRKHRKSLIDYKEKKDKSYLTKSTDEDNVRSLISMNKGREKMREALGMDLQTPREEAIKKFWYLGEFLDLGIALKNLEYDSNLDERKKLLIEYKQKITQLKEKIEKEKEVIN